MTAVAVRPVEDTTPQYRQALPRGVWAIAAVSGVIVVWALVAFVALTFTIGALALVLAGVLGCFDAKFVTPTRIEVTSDGVRLGFWNRTKLYEPKAIVVTHDVRSGRFSLRRHGTKRALVHFHDDDPAAVGAFLSVGVEILSL